jgi:hypothetical protein
MTAVLGARNQFTQRYQQDKGVITTPLVTAQCSEAKLATGNTRRAVLSAADKIRFSHYPTLLRRARGAVR